MINNLKLFFNKYIYAIIVVIAFIVISLIITKTLNAIVGKTKIDENAQYEELKEQNFDVSLIDGTQVNSKTYSSQTTLIKDFTNACQEDLLKAYTMLSSQSKNVLYPTYDTFLSNYISKFFDTKKTVSIKNYKDNTYLVEIRNDIFEYGICEDIAQQEYISVVDGKINVDGLVLSYEFPQTTSVNSIDFTVKRQSYFVDYAQIELTVTNNNNSEIFIDKLEGITAYTKDNVSNVFVLDSVSNDEFYVNGNSSMTYNLKFQYSNEEGNYFNKIVINQVKIGDKAIQNIEIPVN